MSASFQDDAAAMTAITTAGAAARDKLLTPERKTTVAAVAGFNQNSDFVYKQRLFRGDDADKLAQPSAVAKCNHAVNLGEQGVVFAPADVFTGLDFGAALAHDNRPARNQLPAESLHAEPLRIRVAPVFGTA
jgi:hypothetical protein